MAVRILALLLERWTRFLGGSNLRAVIYVKEGEYEDENVTEDLDHWNLMMMYGDGMLKTIISGHKNYADGTPTYSSATCD